MTYEKLAVYLSYTNEDYIINTQDITNSLLGSQRSYSKVRNNRIEAQYQRNLQRQEIQDLIEELSINEQE